MLDYFFSLTFSVRQWATTQPSYTTCEACARLARAISNEDNQ